MGRQIAVTQSIHYTEFSLKSTEYLQQNRVNMSREYISQSFPEKAGKQRPLWKMFQRSPPNAFVGEILPRVNMSVSTINNHSKKRQVSRDLWGKYVNGCHQMLLLERYYQCFTIWLHFTTNSKKRQVNRDLWENVSMDAAKCFP